MSSCKDKGKKRNWNWKGLKVLHKFIWLISCRIKHLCLRQISMSSAQIQHKEAVLARQGPEFRRDSGPPHSLLGCVRESRPLVTRCMCMHVDTHGNTHAGWSALQSNSFTDTHLKPKIQVLQTWCLFFQLEVKFPFLQSLIIFTSIKTYLR